MRKDRLQLLIGDLRESRTLACEGGFYAQFIASEGDYDLLLEAQEAGLSPAELTIARFLTLPEDSIRDYNTEGISFTFKEDITLEQVISILTVLLELKVVGEIS